MRAGSAQALNDATADDRRKLIAAMVEVACEHGYANTTVSRVVDVAGVSRATFYKHFVGRDECFLAAYRDKARAVRGAVEAATATVRFEARPAAVLEVLFGELEADAAAVRLVLVEALAAPAAVRAEHEQLLVEVEQLVARYLDEQPPGPRIQIPAMALLAGVGEVVAIRALTGQTDNLPALCNHLLRWIDAYRLPPGSRPLPQQRWDDLGRFARSVFPPATKTPPLLPRGRSALPAASAARERRRRLLDATARLASADGYSALTVARIVAAARVPRTAFYSHFDCKRDALLAAQTEALQEGMAAAAAAYSPAASWPERVWNAGEALLGSVAANRDYAHLDFVESYAAGELAIRRRHQNHMAFAMFVEDGYRQVPNAPALPSVSSEAVAGAIFGLMRRTVVAGKTERMLSLLPAAAYTLLAPFIGPREAAEQVQGLALGAR